MILIRNLRLDIGQSEEKLKEKAARQLRIPSRAIKNFKITKRSLDARKKNDIHWLYSVAITADNENKILSNNKCKDIAIFDEPEYSVPMCHSDMRPVVVGFGPAGMFAALVLSMAGLSPIVIERGCDALTRKKKVDEFRSGGELDPECNVQFGEGGAGTFSDGKLGTGIRDRRIRWILQTFHDHGAPESILYDAKPHIGTDILINVVQNIRRTVINNGGEVRFNSKLTGLVVENNEICAVKVRNQSGEEYELGCSELVLAIGHSARDTFEMLERSEIPMEPKPFSMGVRIEHKQTDIDIAQYGTEIDSLPAADYSLNVHLPDGTSAYTFCMCPGGTVVLASSEEDMVVVNGMSEYARDGENANSAILVGIEPDYFESDNPLSGIDFQRNIERAAFNFGGKNYNAPVQLVGDFLKDTPSKKLGTVRPTCTTGTEPGDIRKILPKCVTDSIASAISAFDKKLPGYAMHDAVLTAPESRSSSPVRIIRDECRQASIKGIFPCGEGAGYAGGIVSAAVDGIRSAEAVLDDELDDC